MNKRDFFSTLMDLIIESLLFKFSRGVNKKEHFLFLRCIKIFPDNERQAKRLITTMYKVL